MVLDFFNTQIYLLFVIIILSISEILKNNNSFSDTILSILSINSKIPKKWAFSFMVAILGMLPIPGRIVIVNFLLDAVVSKENPRAHRLGTLAYISTHHYYLWSPIETAVIISLGILKISYSEFLSYMVYPILGYMIFYLLYIIFFIKETDFKEVIVSNSKINYNSLWDIIILFLSIIIAMVISNEKAMVVIFLIPLIILIIKYKISFKNIILNLDYKFITSIFIILCIGFLIKNTVILKDILKFISTSSFNLFIIFLICFAFSFLFGSSSRYATIAGNMALLLGIQFFPLLYIVDYCGYILSPVHKCTFFIFSYFKYTVQFILILCILCLSVFFPSYAIFIFK